MSETKWSPSWVTDPPVVSILAGDKVRRVVEQLRTSITEFMSSDPRSPTFKESAWKEWKKSTKSTWDDGGRASADDPELESFRKSPNSYSESWEDRQSDAMWVLDRIKDGKDINLVYVLFGMPVGILCMNQGDPAPVSWLATHPGVAEAGSMLIEAAVAKSNTGRLTLTPLYVAETFYKKIGFEPDGEKLTLTPAPPLWAVVGNKWRLALYQGQKYFMTTKPLPPVPVVKQ